MAKDTKNYSFVELEAAFNLVNTMLEDVNYRVRENDNTNKSPEMAQRDRAQSQMFSNIFNNIKEQITKQLIELNNELS